jgi:hypothetical protein
VSSAGIFLSCESTWSPTAFTTAAYPEYCWASVDSETVVDVEDGAAVLAVVDEDVGEEALVLGLPPHAASATAARPNSRPTATGLGTSATLVGRTARHLGSPPTELPQPCQPVEVVSTCPHTPPSVSPGGGPAARPSRGFPTVGAVELLAAVERRASSFLVEDGGQPANPIVNVS